ncbi:Asparagine synthetase [glutamine-hydrolyzing] 1 [Aliarcobacter thereius]|uniref:asparagine synthase (glutamine-hydrolyzing) n=1 Tax=Aliarcobacter thereius TaxID=544718 RepID=A0A5R9H857_9BACT|nr:asparagine synthase-related protein [Aliarcobacter thereius]OCL88423.1 Asparagine synthetase [glutamine-hydrolyzing] 1 [Aliarcobacter thereius]TLS72638.1 asparagine synthetase B [Aliarcobacter thereius]TLT07725.1 asparagine synthetase B [Aliarcobacter thereius]
MKKVVFDNLEIYFEGEIYNLSHFGYEDEHQLIKDFFIKYGEAFVKKLDGIFAFTIYDSYKKEYFLARDRFGNIPLFYAIYEDKLYFSTSIKELNNEFKSSLIFNKIALSKYMQYLSTFGEDSFYKDIFKLEEASYLVFSDSKLNIRKYHKINTYKAINDEKQALATLEELLYDSIGKRLNKLSGTLLSGGIDSSLISSIYTKISGKKIDTFSVGYEDYKNYCELRFAKKLSNHINSNHYEVIIDKKTYIDNFYSTLNSFDEPHADSASIPLNILLKSFKELGITKLLSGEGADELFLGYNSYSKYLEYYKFKDSLSSEQSLFLNEIISALQNNTKESEYLRRVVKDQNIYNSFGEVFNDIQKRRLFVNVPTFKLEKAKKDPIDWMSYIDIKLWVANPVLTKVYNISKLNNIEIHTPFLDNSILDFAFSIDNSIKKGDTNKYLLKKIAEKYIPKDLILRTKKGFNSPFNEWIHEEFGKLIIETILNVNKETKFFNEEYLKHIYGLSLDGKFKQHLYSLFVFSLWYKKEYLN